MSSISDRLGLQTYSLRAFPGARAAVEKLRECGITRIELFPGHGDYHDVEHCAEIIAPYREAGIAIDALGVHTCGLDEDTDRRVFAFAAAAGASVVGIDLQPATATAGLRNAQRFAAQYGVHAAIHNHGGYHWLGSAQMLEHVFATAGDRIGLCLDTAWAMHAGEDPVRMVERFAARLRGLHVKDFVFDRAGKVQDVVVGEGNLDLAALSAALDAAGYAGYAVLEYEGDEHDPVPAIRRCVAACRQEMSHA